MEFEGEFRVPGRPEEVILRFADVERMARCMPGAVVEGRDEEGAWLGAMVVAFGPKRIRFKGKLTAQTDPATLSGRLQGRGTADLRAARVGFRVDYTVRADPEAPPERPASIVALRSTAELTGVLADFARTGGIAFASALMEEFSRRAAEEFARDLAPPPAAGAADAVAKAPAAAPAAPAPVPAPAQPLQAHRLLWMVIKARLRALLAWLGLRPQAPPPAPRAE
jgi:carbon monoxide dehydrogenase subunit G